jgi:hypothetical protein
MAAASKPDTSKLYDGLSDLYEKAYDLLVHYKKLSKDFSNVKKNLNPSQENSEKKKNEISKNLKFYLGFLAEREKTNLQTNTALANKARNQIRLVGQIRSLRTELAALDKRMKAEKNIDNLYLLDHEKIFLKSKEALRAEKIVLLQRIDRIKLLLKNKLKERFNNYMYSNFDTRYFGEDPDYQNYTGKDIINFLESGPVSEKAAKKSKQINNIKSLENVSNRKTQMEIEIEMIKLESVVKKYNEYEKLFIDKINNIINKERDSDLKRLLFKEVKREKRNNNFVVITDIQGNPVEEKIIDIRRDKFNEFLNSGNTYPKYKKEIAKYKKQIEQLNKKHNYYIKKIDKLKKI